MLAALLLPLLHAQEGQPEAGADALPSMSEKEIEEVSEALGDYLDATKGTRAYEQVRRRFFHTLESVGKAHELEVGEEVGWGPLMKMVGSWAEVFRRVETADRPTSLAGRGRVNDHKVGLQGAEGIVYEYALLLPRRYKADRSWPLIIALHDEGSDGEKYLKEVWEDRSLKELREKFVIMAPTLGEKTRPPNRRQARRIGWFDKLHMLNIYLPLREVLEQCNIDTNRMYLEGVGRGGQTALHLACLRPKDFAAVAIRSARPKVPELLPNLCELPVSFFIRKDGPYSGKEGQAMRQAVQKAEEAFGLAIDFKEHEALSEGEARRARGSQESDPVHDATPEVAAFFESHVRDPYPSHVRFKSTDLRMFARSYWVRIQSGDILEEEGPYIEVRADRESNTLFVKQERVETFSCFLNDRILDMDRPIAVNVNGQEVMKEKVARSLDYALTYFNQNHRDPVVVATEQIRVEVPVTPAPEEAGGDGGEDGKEAAGEDGGDKAAGDGERR